MQNTEESRGVWGHAPPENIYFSIQVGSGAILGHTVALNWVRLIRGPQQVLSVPITFRRASKMVSTIASARVYPSLATPLF